MKRILLICASLLFSLATACLDEKNTDDSASGTDSATINANPLAVSMTAAVCYPSKCTVSKTITITSSTSWTSSDPGFGSLGAYGDFLVSPNSGPAGSDTVTISYTSYGYGSEDGFIRFRTTTIGVHAEVSVTVN